MSVRHMCSHLRECIKGGRRKRAREALGLLKVPCRVSQAKQDLQHILRALRQYQSRFPNDKALTKRTLWRAVRALTPRYVPSPAFERLYIDTVECDLESNRKVLDAYASGRLSIVHRLLHYGYAEAADALEVLADEHPGAGSKLPPGYPPEAAAILRASQDDTAPKARPSLRALRAAMVLSFVITDDLHACVTAAFIRARRPHLLPFLHRVAARSALQPRADPRQT